MVNQGHLDILKQGVEVWNQWRKEHPQIHPDLSGANLHAVNLDGANLSRADLTDTDLYGIGFIKANLTKAKLSRAQLQDAWLGGAKLIKADLQEADLIRAKLNDTYLNDANLAGALLGATNLTRANLNRANLIKAHLKEADLSEANLDRADLSYTQIGWTTFGNVNLRTVKGLDTITHIGPSYIDIRTIYRSDGHISEDFLHKAGVPDSFIDYMHSLVIKPIDYYTCFISYANKDEVFAKRLYADLQSNGVKCWFAPEDMKIGDNIYVRIDESIRQYDKLMLVFSGYALASSWVEREVATALEKEQQYGQRVLFPIRLDETVMQTNQAWAADIRRRKHIGDFTRWKQHDDYQQAFERLLRDLKAEVY